MKICTFGAAASVFLIGCGPSIYNDRTFVSSDPSGDHSSIDSGKGDLEISIHPTFREFTIPIFFEYQSLTEPFHVRLTISYVPIRKDFDSSEIVLESVQLIDQDSHAFELVEGKNQNALIEYLNFTVPADPFPLGNTQIRFNLPVPEDYAFKGDADVKIRVRLKSRKTGSIDVIEKSFRTLRGKGVKHMLQSIHMC